MPVVVVEAVVDKVAVETAAAAAAARTAAEDKVVVAGLPHECELVEEGNESGAAVVASASQRQRGPLLQLEHWSQEPSWVCQA